MKKNLKKIAAVSLASLIAMGALTGCSDNTNDAVKEKTSQTEKTPKTTNGSSEEKTSVGSFISLEEAGVKKGFKTKLVKDWVPYAYSDAGFMISLPVAPLNEASVIESESGRNTQYRAIDGNEEYAIWVIESDLAPKDEMEEMGRASDLQKEFFSEIPKVNSEGSLSEISIAGKKGYAYKTTAEIDGVKYFLNSAAVYRGSDMYIISMASPKDENFDTFVSGFEMIEAK